MFAKPSVFFDKSAVVVDEILVELDVFVVSFENPVLDESEAGEALVVGKVGSVWRSHGELRNGEYLWPSASSQRWKF